MYFFIGVILGMLFAPTFAYKFVRSKSLWWNLILRKGKETNSKKILRRAKRYSRITQRPNTIFRFGVAMVFVIVFIISNINDIPSLFIGSMLGLAFIELIFIFNKPNEKISHYLSCPEISAKYVGRFCSEEDIEDFVDWISKLKLKNHQTATIFAASYLPSDIAFAILSQYHDSPNPDIRKNSIDYYARIRENEAKVKLTPIAAINHLVEKHQSLKQDWIDKMNSENLTNLEKVQTYIELEKSIFSQLSYFRSQGQLYCLRCNAFEQQKQYLDLQWISCRRCDSIDEIVFPIKEVIGQIGGNSGYEQCADKIILSLWNPESKAPIAADIHTLEIIGGQDFNYDWAVSSVLEELQNQAAILRRFNFSLINSPKLNENTIRYLEEFKQSTNL